MVFFLLAKSMRLLCGVTSAVYYIFHFIRKYFIRLLVIAYVTTDSLVLYVHEDYEIVVANEISI